MTAPTEIRAGDDPTAASLFDRATTVHRQPDGCTFAVDLDPTWAIGDKPHGGYLIATLARAGAAAVAGNGQAAGDDGAAGTAPHPHPQATTALFLQPPDLAAAEIRTEVLRRGRGASQVQTMLVQDGTPCVRALHLFGTLGSSTEPWLLDEVPPSLSPWEDCARLPGRPPGPDGREMRVGIAEVADMRFDPAGFAGPPAPPSQNGAGSGGQGGADRRGAAEIRAWLGFADGRHHDPFSLLFALDALPPVTLPLGAAGWAPTLELTCYVRALPAPGPVRVRQRGRLLQDGRLDEVCDIWDAAGRLVAQASQLAGVRLLPGVPPPDGQAGAAPLT